MSPLLFLKRKCLYDTQEDVLVSGEIRPFGARVGQRANGTHAGPWTLSERWSLRRFPQLEWLWIPPFTDHMIVLKVQNISRLY